MNRTTVYALIIVLMFSANSYAKSLLNIEELKKKITINQVSDIWLADGGIGGIEINEYKLASDDFIVVGSYEKIPDDLKSLAIQHNVNIQPSQRYNDIHPVTPFYIQIIQIIMAYGISIGFLIMLILIYRKLAMVLKILTKIDRQSQDKH